LAQRCPAPRTSSARRDDGVAPPAVSQAARRRYRQGSAGGGTPAMSDMRLVVAGAAGRMGRVLVEIIRHTPGAHLAAALEQPGSIAIGQDAGLLAGCGQLGVIISGDALTAIANADGILDFTSPQSTVDLAALAAQARIVHVIGTTGLSSSDLA